MIRTGIYIDDSGNPGLLSESRYDTTDRKSWLALILNPQERIHATQEMEILLDALNADFGAQEFHFTQIYNGKGKFKGVALAKRLAIIETFADIFAKMQWPMIIQSSTGKELDRNNIIFENQHVKADHFQLTNVSDQALFFLLVRLNGFLTSAVVPCPVDIIIDEHENRTAATIHKIDLLGDKLHNRQLTYSTSHTEPLLQLVDFAAFVLNRVRWILSHQSKKPIDQSFLEMAALANFNVLNIRKQLVAPNGNTVAEYDRVLNEVYEKHKQLGEITMQELLKDIYK